MTDLPDEIWSYVFRPPPAWSWSIEPDFDPSRLGGSVLDRDFPAAATSAFAFLEEIGFGLTAADAWEVSSSTVTQYADEQWTYRILERALGGGSNSGAALRLLGGLQIPAPAEEQREILGSLVLRQIKTGDGKDWLETTAVLADSPAFRDQLIAAYRSAFWPGERRRAWWAINAIRRAARDGWPPDDFDT